MASPHVHIHSWTAVLGVSISLVLCFFIYRILSPSHRPPLPPGPKPLPVFGNMLDMARKPPQECFENWHKQFGPIVTLRFGQRVVISVSSHEICHELLDKRGERYASRPRFIIASDHITKGLNQVMIPYGKRWQENSRVIKSLVQPSMAKRYKPIRDIESRKVLAEFLTSNDFTRSFERFSASTLMTLGYGNHLDHCGRREITELGGHVSQIVEAMGNFYSQLVELYPILDSLPAFLAPWKRQAAQAERDATRYILEQFRAGKATSSWNWSHDTLSAQAGKGLPEEELAYIPGGLIQAGYEAFVVTARLLIKAILFHPDCARRAQEEIDSVVGPDRLPDEDDQPRLPYVSAMITEATRWQTPTPMGAPHATTADDEYMGYRIPKGAMIIANLWMMASQADKFPDPRAYRPERWLEEGKEELSHAAFGYGRRICPGRHIAASSLFILVARILWGYNLSHPLKDGKEVNIDPWDVEFGLVMRPKAFDVVFTVRSPERRKIIEHDCRDKVYDIDRILEDLKPKKESW